MSEAKKKSSLPRRIFLSMLRIGLGVLIGLSIFLLFFQSLYLYRPEKEIVMTPGVTGLAYENVSFTAPDGVKLTGWFVPAKDARAAALYCHPNFGNISFFVDSVMQLNRMGLSVFIFDYRGYGKSEGRPSEKGTGLDARAAYDWLLQNKAPGTTVIWGRSLGAAVAARLATERPCHALVLEAPFSSFPDAASDFYPYLPVRLIARFDYNTADYVSRVPCPVLVVASRDDEIIKFSHGERVFAAAHEPKTFLPLRGGHNEFHAVSAKDYEKGIMDFLSRSLPAAEK